MVTFDILYTQVTLQAALSLMFTKEVTKRSFKEFVAKMRKTVEQIYLAKGQDRGINSQQELES